MLWSKSCESFDRKGSDMMHRRPTPNEVGLGYRDGF